MSKIYESGNGYYAFSAIDLQNDGSFDYAHSRISGHVDLDDLRPKFTNLDFFALNNNITEKSGIFPIELWNNTIAINRFPVWNNKVVFEGYVRFNNHRNNHPDGFVFMRGIVNTKPFEIRITDSSLFNRNLRFYVIFNNSGNIRFGFNGIYSSSSFISTTLNINYGSSFNAIEEIIIGNEKESDISLYFFQGSNDFVREFRSEELLNSYSQNFRESIYYNYPTYVNNIIWEETSFKYYIPSLNVENYYYRYSVQQYTHSEDYARKTHLISYSLSDNGYAFGFFNQNMKLVNPRTIYYKKNLFRLYPEQNIFLVHEFTSSNSFHSYHFTPLEEVKETDVFFEIRRSNKGNGNIGFGDTPLLKIYYNKIVYFAKRDDSTIYEKEITLDVYKGIRYLRTNTVSFFRTIDGHFGIDINGERIEIKDYGYTMFSDWREYQSYILFGGSPQRNSLFLDFYGFVIAKLNSSVFSWNENADTLFINESLKLHNYERDTTFYGYLDGNSNYTRDNNYSLFNKFDNIDSDGVIKSLNGAADIIYPSKDWDRLKSYVPVPWEFELEEDFIAYKGKEFISRKIQTKQTTQQEDESYTPLFKCGTEFEYHISGRNSLIYTQYKSKDDEFTHIKNVLFAFDRSTSSNDVSNIILNISSNKIKKNNQQVNLNSNLIVNKGYPILWYGCYAGDSYFLGFSTTQDNYYTYPKVLNTQITTISTQLSFNNSNMAFYIGGYSPDNPDRWIKHFSYSASSEDIYDVSRIKSTIIASLKETIINKKDFIRQFYRGEKKFQDTMLWKFDNYRHYYPQEGIYDSNNAEYNYVNYRFYDSSRYDTPKHTFINKEKINYFFDSSFDYKFSQMLSNTRYKIYGKVEYDGERGKDMEMTLINSLTEVSHEESVIKKLNDNGYYEFFKDSPDGIYKVICEDLTGKYNTQIKDYTLLEEDESSNMLVKINENLYKINYDAYYKLRNVD